MSWITNLLHILVIAPILGYIGYINSNGEPLSVEWSEMLMLVAGLMAAAHVVLMVLKMNFKNSEKDE